MSRIYDFKIYHDNTLSLRDSPLIFSFKKKNKVLEKKKNKRIRKICCNAVIHQPQWTQYFPQYFSFCSDKYLKIIFACLLKKKKNIIFDYWNSNTGWYSKYFRATMLEYECVIEVSAHLQFVFCSISHSKSILFFFFLILNILLNFLFNFLTSPWKLVGLSGELL